MATDYAAKALETALSLDPHISTEYQRYTTLTEQLKKLDMDLKLALDTDPDLRRAEDWDNIRALEQAGEDREEAERQLRLLLLHRYYLVAQYGNPETHTLSVVRRIVRAIMEGEISDKFDLPAMANEQRLWLVTTFGPLSIGWYFNQPFTHDSPHNAQRHQAYPFVYINTSASVLKEEQSNGSEAVGFFGVN